MKSYLKSRRGSMLLAMMIVVMVLAAAVGFLLQYTSTSYRNSIRQQKLVEAKSIAEAEMEYLYYNWKSRVLAQSAANQIAPQLETALHGSDSVAVNSAGTPVAGLHMAPFVSGLANYSVGRGMRFEGPTQLGLIPPSTTKRGLISAFMVQTRAQLTDPTLGTISYNLGRRFIYSETSLFQFSVFYQGDMEISAASEMDIQGDISSNGDIYLAAKGAHTLTVADKVRFAGRFNGASDPDSGTLLNKAGATSGAAYHEATFLYDPDPNDGVPPVQADSRHEQVERLTEPENFIGGVDVNTVLATYPAAYNGDGNNAVVTDADRNLVYRSVIAPPPLDTITHLPIPEDPTVASRRMYNRAGILIRISGSGPTIEVLDPATGIDYASVLGSLTPPAFPSVRSTVYDARESANIRMTTIDVGVLKHALETNPALAALNSAYNGVVYAYDTDAEGAGYKAGIRLANAEAVPNINDKGFSFATDNGLYVQGNYNTTPSGDATNPKVSSALMGDAVTVLSHDFVDSTGAGLLATRRAGSGPVTAGTDDVANLTTIRAAILSGNTPNSGALSTGGVQNLVRYLEDWGHAGQDILLDGSLGQLFTSVHFNSVYKNSGTTDNVYYQPQNRTLRFEDYLASHPPGGAPTTTSFHRGDYFNWED